VNVFQVKSFLRHWLLCVNEHSLHSPFYYRFHEKVIKPKANLSEFIPIEALRSQLLNDHTPVSIADLGAASNYFSQPKRTIAQVARTSITPTKWCAFVARLIRYFESKELLELGTSMGIMSLYMGLQPTVRLTTFEGNPAMVDIALHNFSLLGTSNIKLVKGNIDDTLPAYLEITSRKIDLVWMDANHRYEPTVHYFEMLSEHMAEKGIIIVDDIYHSKEMGMAWQKLQRHDSVYGSLDLFRCGILFLDPTLNKQHVICAL
jgi:predicted O-methyltransferase YrrM